MCYHCATVAHRVRAIILTGISITSVLHKHKISEKFLNQVGETWPKSDEFLYKISKSYLTL